MRTVKRPNTRTNLDKAIQRLYGQTVKFVNIRSLMANAIVGQFLPGAVAKGGSALKLRFGDMATRMTTDFDIAYKDTVESVISALSAGLRIGWNGFDGEVVAQKPMRPKGVREAYVMKPYSVKLRYNKAPWCTVQLEVAFNEIGDADVADIEISEEITKVFESLGFPAPAPVPLMSLEYQVAQKLHGVTEPESERAHDLIDLQIIMAQRELDLGRLRSICKRLFAYRKRQSWPALVVKHANWETIYGEERGELPVLSTVDEAVAWANELIDAIDKSKSKPSKKNG